MPDDSPSAGSAATATAAEPEATAETPAGDRGGFRLAAFGAVLIVVLFAGYGLGRLNESTTAASAPSAAEGATGRAGTTMPGMNGAAGNTVPGANGQAAPVDENQPHAHGADGASTQIGGAAVPVGAAVGGLSLSSSGLTLVPEQTSFTAGRRQTLSFRIAAAGGAPVTTYAVVHDKPLHLIVIRRDLSGFQHLHPTMAPDGTWSIDLTLAESGIHRMIADFTAVVGGQQVATTLGGDLTVAGDYAPRALPTPAQGVAADGFRVTYEGAPDTRSTQPIMVGVTGADGRPVALEPYLGSFGHLVVMRDGDLAYVHVHPEAQLIDGRPKFWLAVPSAGRYRMFFDFQVAGKVLTAAWTVAVE